VSAKQVEGIALVVLGLVSLAVTRWPNMRLARLLLPAASRRWSATDRKVRYARYAILTGVVAFGTWIATGH